MTRANADMIRYWNEVTGPRWVAHHDKLDAQVTGIGQVMLDRLGIEPGHAVLDVGCGCGQTVLQLAERVGESGRVVALDISEPMLGVAARRAREAGHANVELRAADAQTEPLPARAFDRVCSRFGLMFFDDPVAAFDNVRRALRPEGRLAFVCWREREQNEWFTVLTQAVAKHITPPARPPEGTAGAFSLADRERLVAMLEVAGYARISVEPLDTDVLLGGGLSLDESTEFAKHLGGVAALLDKAPSDAVRARAMAEVRDALAPYAGPEGVRMRAAAWLVTAHPGKAS